MYDFNRLSNRIWAIFRERPIYLALALGLLILSFLQKYVLFAIIFSVLDLLNSYIEMKFRIDLLLDFALIGVILLSNYGYIGLSFIVILFFVINRILIGKFEKRHLLKIPIFITISLISSSLGFLSLSILGPVLFLVRFALEYFIELSFFGTLTLNRIPRRTLHFIAAVLFFRFWW